MILLSSLCSHPHFDSLLHEEGNSATDKYDPWFTSDEKYFATLSDCGSLSENQNQVFDNFNKHCVSTSLKIISTRTYYWKVSCCQISFVFCDKGCNDTLLDDVWYVLGHAPSHQLPRILHRFSLLEMWLACNTHTCAQALRYWHKNHPTKDTCQCIGWLSHRLFYSWEMRLLLVR